MKHPSPKNRMKLVVFLTQLRLNGEISADTMAEYLDKFDKLAEKRAVTFSTIASS